MKTPNLQGSGMEDPGLGTRFFGQIFQTVKNIQKYMYRIDMYIYIYVHMVKSELCTRK